MTYNLKKALIRDVVLLTIIFIIAIVTTHHIYYKFKKERNVNYNSPSLDVVFHEKSGDKVTITKVTPVTEHWKKPDVLAKAIHTAYRN